MEKEISNLIWQILERISPPIFWAGLLLLLGIIVSAWIKSLVAGFFNRIRLNQLVKRLGVAEALADVDIRLDAPSFFGEIAKWFFILLSLMASAEILGLTQFSNFLQSVIRYFPNLFVAGIIFTVAIFLADFSKKILIGNLEKEKIVYSRFLGKGMSSAIWILAILAILYQLKIVPNLILVIFIAVITIIVLILGISFGLGGKDLAAKIINDLGEKFKK